MLYNRVDYSNPFEDFSLQLENEYSVYIPLDIVTVYLFIINFISGQIYITRMYLVHNFLWIFLNFYFGNVDNFSFLVSFLSLFIKIQFPFPYNTPRQINIK